MSRLHIVNPATGEPVGDAPDHSVEECLVAVERAHIMFPQWSSVAPRQRGEVLRRAFELMIAEQEELARLIVAENGKVLADARAEVTYAAEFFRWFSEEAVRIDGDLRRAPNGQYWLAVTREPVGPALCITPWNFPAAMATRKIGPALAAGCTVVLKAAAETPLTAYRISEILVRAGLPEGVVTVVTPSSPGPAVEAMLASGKIRKLSFTGSTRVGSVLLKQAADRIINCSMELGGNAPFVVCEDADIPAAVEGAMLAKMRNGGAACTAANRFYVHRAVAGEFTGLLADRMSALRVGDGLADGTGVGPLVSAAQQQRVASLVERAVTAGAKVLCGGRATPAPMHGYEPTVLVDVDSANPVLAEEIFGPVAPIVTVDDIEASMHLLNGVDHGLVSYVYTRDTGRGMRIASALESGMVGLNRGLVSDPAAPFGGVKQSGIGREGAHEGLLEFCETKYVATQW